MKGEAAETHARMPRKKRDWTPETPAELEDRAQRLFNMAASMQFEAQRLMVQAAMRREARTE